MLYNNYNSDHDHGYGSGSSGSPWLSQQELRWAPPRHPPQPHPHKSSSYSDLVSGRCTLEEVMREFRMNGSDAPYDPDGERGGSRAPAHDVVLSGMGPPSAYLRQQSWPAPERTPAAPLPHKHFATSTPVFDEVPPFTPLPMPPPAPAPAAPALSAEQARVLASLPPALLDLLLRHLQQEKRARTTFQECRFCKNNGERESFYRAHALKDARGRVACPVLRAFRCARCGAAGDRAHTAKYCPLATNEERMKSTAMMRSVRMASGRRRAAAPLAPPVGARADYVVCGEPARALSPAEPLDPLWAALEQKLLL